MPNSDIIQTNLAAIQPLLIQSLKEKISYFQEKDLSLTYNFPTLTVILHTASGQKKVDLNNPALAHDILKPVKAVKRILTAFDLLPSDPISKKRKKKQQETLEESYYTEKTTEAFQKLCNELSENSAGTNLECLADDAVIRLQITDPLDNTPALQWYRISKSELFDPWTEVRSQLWTVRQGRMQWIDEYIGKQISLVPSDILKKRVFHFNPAEPMLFKQIAGPFIEVDQAEAVFQAIQSFYADMLKHQYGEPFSKPITPTGRTASLAFKLNESNIEILGKTPLMKVQLDDDQNLKISYTNSGLQRQKEINPAVQNAVNSVHKWMKDHHAVVTRSEGDGLLGGTGVYFLREASGSVNPVLFELNIPSAVEDPENWQTVLKEILSQKLEEYLQNQQQADEDFRRHVGSVIHTCLEWDILKTAQKTRGQSVPALCKILAGASYSGTFWGDQSLCKKYKGIFSEYEVERFIDYLRCQGMLQMVRNDYHHNSFESIRPNKITEKVLGELADNKLFPLECLVEKSRNNVVLGDLEMAFLLRQCLNISKPSEDVLMAAADVFRYPYLVDEYSSKLKTFYKSSGESVKSRILGQYPWAADFLPAD